MRGQRQDDCMRNLAGDCSRSGEQHPPSGPSTKWMDRVTLGILLVGAAVSLCLSSAGARELFSGRAALGYAFASVVQAVGFITLWELPRRRLLVKCLLLCGWVASTTFSVGAAFYASYQSSAVEDVAVVVDNVSTFLGGVGARIEDDQRAASLAEKSAAAESKQGTYSAGLAGPGPVYRRLQQEALEARAKAEQSAGYKVVLEKAREALKAPKLTTTEVRNIYNDAVAALGSYANGIPAPEFDHDRRSYTTIVFAAVAIATGLETHVAPNERKRVTGALVSASCMELLTLITSFIRMAVHARTRGRSWVESIAAVVVGVLSLGHVPYAVKAGLIAQRTKWQRWIAKERQDADLVAAHLPDDSNGQSMRSLWRETLHSQAASGRRRKVTDLIASLLPSEVALQGRPSKPQQREGQRRVPARRLFHSPVFKGKKLVLNIALQTNVVSISEDGQLVPGAQWDEWVLFLLRTHAEITRAERKPGAARAERPPYLRAV
jgi:hypothetical protein